MSKFDDFSQKVGKFAGFATEFLQDMKAYIRYCGVSPFQDAQKRRFYKLLIECHALEKGLSLRDPRPLFGQAKLDYVMAELDRYDAKISPLPAEMILGTLASYAQTHRARGVDDPLLDRLEAYVADRRARLGVTPHGGLRHFDRAYADVTRLTPAEFLASRFSSRTFADETLDPEEVARIVALAQMAPSQCNRQASHAWFYQAPDKIAALLALQGGSSGFAEDVRNLFVITSDLAAWGGPQQRNQLYVDGALFSMSLIYAMHAHGVATCPLNLAVANGREREIRAVGGIPVDQRVIMMIAVGKPLNTTAVAAACSPRRMTSEILHFAG